jgi:hypothetical protein
MDVISGVIVRMTIHSVIVSMYGDGLRAQWARIGTCSAFRRGFGDVIWSPGGGVLREIYVFVVMFTRAGGDMATCAEINLSFGSFLSAGVRDDGVLRDLHVRSDVHARWGRHGGLLGLRVVLSAGVRDDGVLLRDLREHGRLPRCDAAFKANVFVVLFTRDLVVMVLFDASRRGGEHQRVPHATMA